MRNLLKVFAIATLFSSGAGHAATPQWSLSESTGNVNVLRAGVSKIALTGSTLQPGDVVAAGPKSRAVLVRGEEYVAVSPNSRIRISQPRAEGGVVQFFQEIGNAIFRIDKKATPHFGVATPYLAAVVKGTTFSVTVTDAGAAVQVTEGAVQVATLDGGATQLLTPGMIGMVDGMQQFRLTVSGAQPQVIDSPNAPAGSNETPEPMDEAGLLDIASSGFEGTISAPVLETPVSLGTITSGLVQNRGASDQSPRVAFNDRAAGEPGSRGNSGMGSSNAAQNAAQGVFRSDSSDAMQPSGGGNGNGENGNGAPGAAPGNGGPGAPGAAPGDGGPGNGAPGGTPGNGGPGAPGGTPDDGGPGTGGPGTGGPGTGGRGSGGPGNGGGGTGGPGAGGPGNGGGKGKP